MADESCVNKRGYISEKMTNIPNLNIGAFSSFYSQMTNAMKQYINSYVGTCIPARVVNVKPVQNDIQLVDVKPILKNITTLGEEINITGTYYNVPLMTFRGNDCDIKFNVNVGDFGLLIACKYDISGIKNGESEAKIGSERTFSFSDGFFIPLFFNSKGEGIIISNKETVMQMLPEAINITTKAVTTNVVEDTMMQMLPDSVELKTKYVTVNVDDGTVLQLSKDSVNIQTKTITVNAENATVNASSVNLGGEGGQEVARKGDSVQVVVESGSSSGTWNGTITGGSGVVKSV